MDAQFLGDDIVQAIRNSPLDSRRFKSGQNAVESTESFMSDLKAVAFLRVLTIS